MRRTLSAALLPLVLAASPAAAQRWYATEVVAPPPTAVPLPTSGYARFYVSSHLEPLGARPYQAHGSAALLVVNVSISPGGGAPAVEYPVALYDLRQRRRVEVAALQLGEVRYLDLRAGSQPVVTLKVQAVPRAVADPFRRAVDQFNRQIQAIPVLELSGQLSGLSRLLGSILPPEVEDAWTSTQTIGLSARPDLTLLPLDGRPAVVFFRPTGGNARIPASWDEIRPCAGSPGRVCWAADGRPVTGVPYVVLAVTVEDYRRLADFGAGDFVCAPAALAEHAARLERVVRDAPLSQEQRDLEGRLLEEVRLLADVAAGRVATAEGAAAAAFRWTRRDMGRGDPYWTAHGAAPAERHRRCLDQLLTAMGPAAAARWTYFHDAFATAAAWDRQPPAGGAARVAQLEGFLNALLLPITVYRLGDGEEHALLRAEQRRIEAELLAADRALAAEAGAARGEAALEGVRERIRARLGTPCEACRPVLAAALGEADDRLAALRRTAAATAEAARLRGALAGSLGEAEQVAAAAEGVDEGDVAALAALREAVAEGRRLLEEGEADAPGLERALGALREAVERMRRALDAPAGG